MESTRDKRVDICNSKAPRAIISSSVTRVSLRVAILAAKFGIEMLLETGFEFCNLVFRD